MARTTQPDPSFFIESPRLFLSHLIANNPKHCRHVANVYFRPKEPQAEVGAGEVDAVTKAHNFIKGRSNGLLSRLGYGIFLCSLKTESNKLEDAIPVGVISMIRRDETQEKDEISYTVPDIGFGILPQERGKGYAAEGSQAIIKYATETLGLEGVLGFTSSRNVAGQRTLEKAGMEYRGDRVLGVFKGARSVVYGVYALPGMRDLREYNIADDPQMCTR